MTITKKTRLLPPPFVGTRIKIALDNPESLTWGMNMLLLAEGRNRAIIDWGDGTTTEIEGEARALTHTYAETGEYEVRISDDIEHLQCSILSAVNIYRKVYAPMIQEFHTRASRMKRIYNYCFNGATNLHTFRSNGSGVTELGTRTFASCTALVGRLDLPDISQLGATTFASCTGITELHFSAANEAAIEALPEWETSNHKFGAENATAYFDL